MLDRLKRILPLKTKIALIKAFPKMYIGYKSNYIINTFELKKYYCTEDHSLHFGKSILPMKIIQNCHIIGELDAEFNEIVYPMLPNGDKTEKLPYIEGPYELGSVKLGEGDIVFDCGANLGLFSVMAGNLNCTCYAFEPLPANYNAPKR